MCGILFGMGLKTSVWLPDDLAERVKASGVPMAELIRRGLGADAPDPLEVRLAAVIRAEFEARFRPGSPVMPVVDAAPAKRPRKAPEAPAGPKVSDARVQELRAMAAASDVEIVPADEIGRRSIEAHIAQIAAKSAPEPAVVTPSLRRASDLSAPLRCPHPGTRQIGGWCSKCQVTVLSGGKLPDGWVKPEGWAQ